MVSYRKIFIILIQILSTYSKYFKENQHHNNAEVEKILKDMHRKCPSITKLRTLTDFKNNRYTLLKNKLIVIEFGNPPGRHISGRPEFKYIGNMHGNEVISREILLGLVVHLCEQWTAGNHSIRSLVDRTRIHILVSMNPDGWAIATNASYHNRNIVTGRRTASNIDLNRNFPPLNKRAYLHFFRGKGKLDHLLRKIDLIRPMAPETQMVMKWMLPIPFVLSANLHGGEVVANYPYDESMYPGQYVYSRSPDDVEFRRLSLTYSKNHPEMSKHSCKRNFKDGITNGADWYSVKGGMQDFNYLATNCFEITLEVSCIKYPRAQTLPRYHRENLPPLLAFMWEVHSGVKGKVYRKHARKGYIPAQGAMITVYNVTTHIGSLNRHAIISGKQGDYFRLLTNGRYEITAALPGMSDTRCVTVKNEPQKKDATVVNFHLHPGVRSLKGCNAPCPTSSDKRMLNSLQRKLLLKSFNSKTGG